MATTISASPGVKAASGTEFLPEVQSDATSVPWFVWALFTAVVSVVIGGYWDISWHMSIGRDTFWTPAHIAIQMCGVIAGLSCAYLIFACTFGNHPAAREASVQVWNFRGPLGAFIAAWGGATMLASAPFDNWWHNAYGLDVAIFSPPHVVLDGGVLAIQVGAVVLMASTRNRSRGALREKLDWFLLLVGGMILMLAMTVVWESTYRVLMHTPQCYRAIAIVAPVVLVGFAGISERRWASTTVAGIYSLYAIAMLWIIPLFPATPKLGPVYQNVTHMVPMEFPILLIVPAVCLDLLRPQIAPWGKWPRSLVMGCVFLGTLLAVQWPFATFVISPASANWFFGTKYFAYFASPTGLDVRHMFFPGDGNPFHFVFVMAQALVLAILSSALGFTWGDWVRKIRR